MKSGPVCPSHTRPLITQCPVRRRPASSCRVVRLPRHPACRLVAACVRSRCCAASGVAVAGVVGPLVPPPSPGNGPVAQSVLSSSGIGGNRLRVCCALGRLALAFLIPLVSEGFLVPTRGRRLCRVSWDAACGE